MSGKQASAQRPRYAWAPVSMASAARSMRWSRTMFVGVRACMASGSPAVSGCVRVVSEGRRAPVRGIECAARAGCGLCVASAARSMRWSRTMFVGVRACMASGSPAVSGCVRVVSEGRRAPVRGIECAARAGCGLCEPLEHEVPIVLGHTCMHGEWVSCCVGVRAGGERRAPRAGARHRVRGAGWVRAMRAARARGTD